MLLHVEDKIAALTAIPANHGEVRLPCPAADVLLPCECESFHEHTLSLSLYSPDKQAAWLNLLPSLQPFNVLRYQPGQHYDSQ